MAPSDLPGTILLEVRGTIQVFPGDQDPRTETGLSPEYERQLRELFGEWFVDLRIKPARHTQGIEVLEEYGLHRRALNPLLRYRISSMTELLQFSDDELLDIPSFGLGCLNELRRAIQGWADANQVKS